MIITIEPFYLSIYAYIYVDMCDYGAHKGRTMRYNHEHQVSRINDVLQLIHADISAPLLARDLAKIAAYSEQHFHRVFKRVVGETVNVYIRRTRLEHAANQLMFDQQSKVINIAEKCGFSSLASFSHAFKEVFKTTPAKWRLVRHEHSSPPYLADQEIAAGYQRVTQGKVPEPKLLVLEERHVAYVRHKGYGRGISKAWQTLQSWALSHGREFGPLESDNLELAGQQIGLHHSNPEWVPLKDCLYVACLTIDKPIARRGLVNSLTIPAGLHAVFELNGQYGDLLPLIGRILNAWLPDSGYTLQTTPTVIHYHKNHFLESDERFEVRLHLPISLV
jgi:AraC family transcriptional regulator